MRDNFSFHILDKIYIFIICYFSEFYYQNNPFLFFYIEFYNYLWSKNKIGNFRYYANENIVILRSFIAQMAVFHVNECKYLGCGLEFQSLGDLIHHIEDTHIGI